MTYLKDFVQSTLSSGVDNVETGFPLSDASDFPDPDRGHYWAYVWDAGSFPDPADDANAEEVLVTAKTGNTLTVVRGRGTQTAVAHSAGEKVAVMGSAANIGHSTYVTPAAYDVDTTGSTAQQTKLQQMIDDLDDTRGGTIYLPEGTYLISAQLAISSKTNVSLIGAGPNTVIKTATTGHTMLAISTSTKIRVENIRFEGAGTGTTGVAINLANVDDSEFRNLQFGGTGDQAISMTRPVSGTCSTDSSRRTRTAAASRGVVRTRSTRTVLWSRTAPVRTTTSPAQSAVSF